MKAVLIVPLLPVLFLSLLRVYASVNSSQTMSSTGSISDFPRVDISVSGNTSPGINSLSLGFMLDGEWRTWSSNPEYRRLAQNASFKLVRFFDWKSSSPRPCTYWNESSERGVFNWTEVDLLVGRIFDIGAEPLITLGSYAGSQSWIPNGMLIDPHTALPYPTSFAAYCAEWVNHFKAVGFPVRYYEIWNEPAYYFYKDWNFNSTKLSYFFELFNTTYVQMHQANSGILIGNDASLYRVFLDYWIQQNGRLDFLSFHGYDSYGMAENETVAFNRTEQLYFKTDGIWYGVNDARQKWLTHAGVWMPAIDSECNFAAVCDNGTDPRIQQMVGAVWTALQLRSCVLNGVNYSVYYSFGSSATWQKANTLSEGLGFGMVNTDNGQPWYPFYVQELVGRDLSVGDRIVTSTSSSDDVRSLAWVHNGGLNLLLICKTNQSRTAFLQGILGEMEFSRIDDAISYLTPSVQNGTITSSQPLILKGYAVILLKTQ